MSRVPSWIASAFVALALAAAGCGGSGSSKNDGGVTAQQICTPNATACVNDSTATICAANGLSLIPVQCGVGQKCSNGACATDPNAPCSAADDTCSDSTHALLCTTNGATSVACPAGTVCQGPGLCVGACTVGESYCDNQTGALMTCTDGKTFTATTCGTGTLCVQTGSSPIDTAACQPADCTPDPFGCDFVCGDKTPGGTGTAMDTVSFCTPTPAGYKWVALTCLAPQTCNSAAGGQCGPGRSNAACATQCNPGDTRCVDGTGFVTCGADSTWGTTKTACNGDATQAQYLCFTSFAGQGVCGDPACYDDSNNVGVQQGSGACDANGKFHLCGADGRVSADITPCDGSCVVSNSGVPGGYEPGACVTQCTDGAQRCLGTGSYQICTNGNWGPGTPCTSGSCIDATGTNGLSTTYCGECIPGTHQCNGDQIETCQTDATWGTDTACAMGTCIDLGNDASCIAQCFPGKTVCIGNSVQVPGVNVWATDTQGTCTAAGTYPDVADGTACTTGMYCRTGPNTQSSNDEPGNGVSYGCVVCVGTQNEFGIPDTRCENVDDSGAGNFIEQCKADNSGWDEANHTDCSANSQSCTTPSTDIPPYTGNFCQDFPGFPITESNLANLGYSCEQFNLGAPVSCGLYPQDGGGTVTDCCAYFCGGPAPTPAYCD